METFKIRLDFRSKKPLSLQLQEQIKQLIEQNVLTTGAQLPAVRTMAGILNVNFNTVARAYRALDLEGWISTQRGRGTFILEPADRLLSEEPLVTVQPVKMNLIPLAAELCQQAARSGITKRQLHKMIDQQIIKARFRYPLKKHHPKHISKKPIYETEPKIHKDYHAKEKTAS